MLETADSHDSSPNIDEMYSSAVTSSGLKMRSDRRTHIDLIAAAGMNPERLGMALHRLETEWHAAAHIRQVMAWRFIATDPTEPERFRKAARWALEQLHATPIPETV